MAGDLRRAARAVAKATTRRIPRPTRPLTYLADLEALFAAARTSAASSRSALRSAGMLTMLLAATGARRSPARCSTTSGRRSSESGLERIREVVGQGRSFPTWMHAARGLRENRWQRSIPDYDDHRLAAAGQAR